MFDWRPSRQLLAQAAISAPDLQNWTPGVHAWAQTKQAIAVKVTRVIVAVASNKFQKGTAMLHPKQNIKRIPRNRDTTINLQKQGPFVLFKKKLSILR